MLLVALVPILATAIGTALGLGARRWQVVLEPVRSFALAAVTATIVVHLMPEAAHEIGPWALAVLAGGLLLPTALGWIGARFDGDDGDGHARVAVELTFLGVLAHQVGDGLALGALTDGGAHGRWDVLLAIAAHTVPLAAVVAITFAERRGRGAALVRAALLAVTPIAGIAIGGSTAATAAGPWLDAAVSGLLLHVLAHDLPSARGRTPAVRSAELVAIAAGIALPFVATDAHAEAGARVVAQIAELALVAAPPVLAGILVGAAVHAAARRSHVRWIAGGRGPVAALRGALLGVPLPPCSCDVVPVGRELRERGGAPGFVSAFVVAAPELSFAAFLLTATLLGVPLALLRLGAAIAIGAVVGIVVERVSARADAPADAALPPGPRSFLDAIDDHLAHDGAWITVGLIVAAFVLAASPAPLLAGAPAIALVLALATAVTISATAATPLAFVLLLTGVPTGAALAALLLATMITPRTLLFLRATLGGAAALAALATAVALALAAWALVAALAPLVAPIDLPRPLELACAGILLALFAASLWRHGLTHWLAALRGSDHGHTHAHGAPHCDHHDH